METSTRRIADAMDRQTAALENMARLFATRAPIPSVSSISQGQPMLSSPNSSVPLVSAAVDLSSALNVLQGPQADAHKAPVSPSPCESEECPPEAKKIKTEDN